jgi:hypothetical protein
MGLDVSRDVSYSVFVFYAVSVSARVLSYCTFQMTV